MHRVPMTAPLIVTLVLGLMFAGLSPTAHAQDESTPTADEEEAAPEGVTFELLGFGTGSDLGTGSDVVLVRVIFEPGAVLPILEEDPEPAILVTEEGTLTILMEDATLNVLSIGDGSFESEEIDAGDEYELQPGFSCVIPGSEAGEIRNDTDEDAIGLTAIVSPSENESDDDNDCCASPPEDEDEASEDTTSDADASDDSDDASEEVEVTISDFTFEPATLEIEAGTTVVWTNLDSVSHTASANNGTWDSDTLGEGDTFSMTFDDPGTFEYGCVFHPSMEGSIVVS